MPCLLYGVNSTTKHTQDTINTFNQTGGGNKLPTMENSRKFVKENKEMHLGHRVVLVQGVQKYFFFAKLSPS